jgi:carboxymethylenebutenolidase
MTADPKRLGAMFDAHCAAEFETRDINATMATMSEAPHITNVPTMTGGTGRDAVRRFYDSWFVGHLPEDWTVTPVSRTVDENQVSASPTIARWRFSFRASRRRAAK